jgi:hypothetical protein
MYLCETRLKQAEVPRVDVQMTPEQSVEESMEIVDALLQRKGRILQTSQREVVRLKIAGIQEKTALYITLSAMVISKWTSEVDAGSCLPEGVIPLIETLFDTLEKQFGSKMTRLALALLTFGKKRNIRCGTGRYYIY